MATIIHSDGREEEVQPKNGTDFQLDEIKAIVGEGAPSEHHYFEIVSLPDSRIMLINEEGKLIDLPRNEKATRMACLPSPEERARAIAQLRRKADVTVISSLGPREVDYIAGTVLVCEDQEVQ